MNHTKYLLPTCLLLGLVIEIGLRGVGWLAHMVVPGLLLGLVLFVVIETVLLVKRVSKAIESLYNSDVEDDVPEGYELKVARDADDEVISVAFIDHDNGLVEAPRDVALAWAKALILALAPRPLH